MIFRGIAILFSCLVFVGSASAEGWTIKDLGSTLTEEACVDLGWDVFDRYRTARSVGDLQRTGWVVYAYDLSHDDFDGVITCSFGPEDTTRATLAIYSVGDADAVTRKNIADRIENYWDQMNEASC